MPAPSRLVSGRTGGRAALAVALLCSLAPSFAAAATPTDADSSARAAGQGVSLVWLEIGINGQAPDTSLLLRDPTGHLWATRADLQRWRLPLPAAQPQIFMGETYYPLDALAGLRYRIEEATQSASLSAPAALFAPTIVDQQRLRYAAPEPAPPGAFLNYDVIVSRAPGTADELQTTASGSFELGTFNRWGTGTTTFIRSDSASDTALTRLESTWTQDNPQDLASLRLGDSTSGVSSWSGAVRFGGIQWSTDFTTQPGFVTTPLAAVKGEAVLPSTVDLYINNALRLQTDVPPGPFVIENLPLISGAGAAQIVVRNMLGQEQQISVPYYSSPALLRAGLSSFSYEIGATRDDYGIASDDYGRALAIGTYRFGFTDTFTAEEHAELLPGQQTLGLAGIWLVNRFAVINAALSASHSSPGDGAQALLGIERDARYFSFGASARFASADYVQVGQLPGQLAPVRLLQDFVSFALPGRGSMAADYIQQDYRDQTSVHLLSLQAGWPMLRTGFLNFTALKPLRGGGSTILGINLTYSFGPRTSATASMNRQNDVDQEQLLVQENLPPGTGIGYRVAASSESTAPWTATFDYQNDDGTYAVSADRVNDQYSESVEAQGGIALLDGAAHLGRRLDESFAVVRVGDYPGVRVYADNQQVAVTDSNGMAMVPRIRPYENNTVRIDPNDLPLDADVATYELNAVPYRRSGVLVDFKARPTAGALISLMLLDGQPMPVGAVVTLAGSNAEFPIGKDGAVYVTGLTKSSVLRVRHAGQLCEVRFSFTPSADPIPWLGPYLCGAVHP